MGSQVTPGVAVGQVLTGGVAQQVVRQDGMVLIWLTCMPGHPAAACAQGETMEVLFAEPVAIRAGSYVSVIIEWLPSGSTDDAGPLWMPRAALLDRAHIRR